MPAKDFKFISPGVFINEIDNSQLPAAPVGIGPVVIGRSEMGPGLIPTRVTSFQEFVEVFGAPNPGGTGGDVSRKGTITGPTYGTYAAQAWLKNNSPITYVRLVGRQHSNAAEGGEAGWALTNGADEPTPTPGTDQGGAYGLFVFESGSTFTDITGTLAATWYVTTGTVALSGTAMSASGGPGAHSLVVDGPVAATREDAIILDGDPADGESFTIAMPSGLGADGGKTITIIFKTTMTDPAAESTIIHVKRGTGTAQVAIDLRNAIDGVSDNTKVRYGTGIANGITNGIASLNASDLAATTAARVSLKSEVAGAIGNSIVVTNVDTGAETFTSPIGGKDAKVDALTNTFVKATGNREFKVLIGNGAGTEIESKFDFSNSSENFIRKVFNTTPTLTNSDITDSTSNTYRTYWLGESFEDEVNNTLSPTGGSNQYGVILPLFRGGVDGGDFLRDFGEAETGFFFAQDLTSNSASFDAASMDKLFKLRARNAGKWTSANIKVSIADIRASNDPANDYGSFSVVIRKMDDTDNRPKILEQFNNCNLNPSSENFVARKIGDRFLEWDDDERRYRQYGDYANASDYVYVVLDDSVREGKVNPESLPFGVYGPPKFLPVSSSDVGNIATLVTGGLDYKLDESLGSDFPGILVSGGINFPVTLDFPSLRLRASSSEGNPTDPTSVFYGVDTTFNLSGRPSKTIGEYTGAKPAGVSMTDLTTTGDAQTEHMYLFTLDDMCIDQADGTVALSGSLCYKSGSRQATEADDTERGGLTYIRETAVSNGSYRQILDLGADRFTTVLHGGFDGLDITEAEPFRNTGLVDKTERTSYAFNSLKVAIDSLRDPDNVEFDIAAMPGITNNTLNRNIIDMCETRGDALAIVDLQGGYVPETENKDSVQDRVGSVQATLSNKRQSLQINSSFGAAYYPWVQIQDTIQGSIIWAPPSVAALGAMSYGQATQELWFAPAGFTRGGLSVNNAAGIPVVGVRERLISKDRDKLYEANVNPIAQFPAEGIVIFGQKTLQVTPSALDRINVRRLMIFVKKQISRISATLLFDQNVDATWTRFLGQAEPFLASVQARLGLTDYKLILDETTTTPDLVDRNIMYAQIFLKPARAIEFIAIDFVITDSGASFED